MNTKWEIIFLCLVQQSKANYRVASSWDIFFPDRLNDCNIMLFFMRDIIKSKDATRVLDMPKHIYKIVLTHASCQAQLL